VFLIGLGVGIRGLGVGLNLSNRLVWWSTVSLIGGVVSISLLSIGVIFMTENRAKLPDWLVFVINLEGALVWWSRVGGAGRVISVTLLGLLVISVIEDGAKFPDWFVGGDEAKKACNSK